MFAQKQIIPNLYHLKFDSISNLGKALIRPQEFAESPLFQNKVFTTSELKRKYNSRNPYISCLGVNIPGHYLTQFFDTFPSITKAELEVFTSLKSAINDRTKKYYLIASYTPKNNKESLNADFHEIAHGLYYINDEYKQQQIKIVSETLSQTNYNKIKSRLLAYNCYNQSVIEDEIHAYLATDSISILKHRFNYKESKLPDDVLNCHLKLKESLNSYVCNISLIN